MIKELESGMYIELKDGWNIYFIIDEADRHLKLKCISFVRPENLGDLIMCNQEGQEIWIAKFHSFKFEESTQGDKDEN